LTSVSEPLEKRSISGFSDQLEENIIFYANHSIMNFGMNLPSFEATINTTYKNNAYTVQCFEVTEMEQTV